MGFGRFFALIAILWGIQLFFAWRQARRFQAQLSELRKDGSVAIGVGGKRYRGGRAYVALSADDKGIIQRGLLLTGITTMAKGKPFNDYKGFSIHDVAEGNQSASGRKPKVTEAARMAAEHIRDHLKRKGGE